MPKVETVLYFVTPKGDSKAQITVKPARLVNTVPIANLVEAIQAKFGRKMPDILSGQRIRVFIEVDTSSRLTDYEIRDGDMLILWIEQPEELVEEV